MKEKTKTGDNLKDLLGSTIKRLRLNSGYSTEEMAEKAGISVPFLGAIERGEKWPSPATLSGIAQGLDVSPYELLKPENSASRDIQGITKKLVSDISSVVNDSLKLIISIEDEINISQNNKTN